MPRNYFNRAANTLYEIVEEYKNRGIQICFVKVRIDLRVLFQRSGLLDLIEGHQYQKIRDAVTFLQSI